VKGARVKVVNKSCKYRVKTDSDGYYEIDNVEFGNYKLKVSKRGYRLYKKNSIEIGGDANFDVKLIHSE